MIHSTMPLTHSRDVITARLRSGPPVLRVLRSRTRPRGVSPRSSSAETLLILFRPLLDLYSSTTRRQTAPYVHLVLGLPVGEPFPRDGRRRRGGVFDSAPSTDSSPSTAAAPPSSYKSAMRPPVLFALLPSLRVCVRERLRADVRSLRRQDRTRQRNHRTTRLQVDDCYLSLICA